MVDFNLRLGKGKSADDVNLNNLKGGISAEKVDDKYKSIFNALDKTGQTEGVLEESEVNDLKSRVQNFAKNNIFSKHEAGKLLSSLGLKDVKAETFFGFLKDVIGISANIESSTTDTQGNTSVAEKQGDTSLTSVYDKTGKLVYAYDTNGNQTKKTDKDENGKVTSTTEYTYDTNGNKTKETYKDENGVVKDVIISNKGYDIKLTSDGDINTYAKNGESFEATMKRLGITEEDDIAIFKAANKKALSRSNGGWFKVGESEVVIPKQLVEKLNMLADTSKFVDGEREVAKWYADKRK